MWYVLSGNVKFIIGQNETTRTSELNINELKKLKHFVVSEAGTFKYVLENDQGEQTIIEPVVGTEGLPHKMELYGEHKQDALVFSLKHTVDNT